MATILNLAVSGEIIKVDPGLGLREMEMRRIFILPRVERWFLEDLPSTNSSWNIEVTPSEQLDALFYEFCSGQPLQIGKRFKSLIHLGDGVWQLKTADLRLFGWFAHKDCFIASDCDDADKIKRMKLYKPYCEQSVRFRCALNLDEPKFIVGDDPNYAVSDCY